MINIVVPLAGPNLFFDDARYPYPKPLIEIGNETMIELFIKNMQTINDKLKFIFIINESDCKKYHLDSTLNILTNYGCCLIKITEQTKGAACSVLMAIEHINNDFPLIVANADQILNINLNEAISVLDKSDAGVITFKSVHPRWSFVKLDKDRNIVETAEKRPLSKEAIAGFYYFSHGRYYIDSAMNMIRKDASIEGNFYIAPVFNELVLKNLKLNTYRIENSNFHTFYTPQKIDEYERALQC